MQRKKLEYLTIQHFVFLSYFIVTTVLFFLSINQGNEGVSVNLFGGGDDGYFYWEQAKNVADGKPWIRTSIYPLIIGIIIKITDIRSVYIIRIFNYIGFLLLVFFSIWLIKTQLIYDSEINKKNKYKSINLLLIMYLVYASLQMNVNLSIYRDIWIYNLYVLATFLSIKFMFYKNNRCYYFFAWCATLVILGEFRTYAMLAFLLGFTIQVIYTKVKSINKVKPLLFLISILFIVYYTFFKDFSVLGMSLSRALDYREGALTNYSGGSQMWISLNQSNLIVFLINYIHSYIGNLIGPLPWHISGGSTLIVFIVETIPMTVMLIFLYKKRNLLTNVQKYILLQGFVWISLIGFTNDNIGTATRLRVVAWLLILCVFVVIYYKNKYLKESMKGKD